MMKNIIYILITAFLFHSCVLKQDQKNKLVGKWLIDQVFDAEKDVTLKHNPNNNRYIQFMADFTFVRDGDPFGRNIGEWLLNEEKMHLIIDSQVDDDDSEWNIKIEEDLMLWTGIGNPRKEGFKLTFKKIE